MSAAIRKLARSLLHPFYRRYILSRGGRERCFRAWCYSRFEQWRREHPAALRDAAGFADRSEMYERLVDALGLDGRIDYLEFGVYRGASLRWWLTANRQPDSRFVGFDSFAGLPADWSAERPAGHFDVRGAPPEIDDPRCEFRVGWFEQTLPGFLDRFERGGRLVAHLDADLYGSTLVALLGLARILRSGDVLIFDEFWDYRNEFRAFLDWQEASGAKCELLAATAGHRQVALRVR